MSQLPTITDLSSSITNNQLVKALMLNGGNPEMSNGEPIRYVGGFCIVFPYMVNKNKYAVRCWHSYIKGIRERTEKIAETLKNINRHYFVDFQYVQDGIITTQGVQPIVVMRWVDAKPLKSYILHHLNNQQALYELGKRFFELVKDLHQNNISHGDLQSENILVAEDGQIFLIDYDSMYVPALEGWKDVVRGKKGYQHPARWKNKYLSPKADYFSEIVIYTSILALAAKPKLWEDLNLLDTETLLFTPKDFESNGQSSIFSILESIPVTKRLGRVIVDFLSRNSIDDLEPLENILKSPVDEIAYLWNQGNGEKMSDFSIDEEVSKIVKKW